MKRIFPAVLALALLLCACTAQPEPTPTPEPTPEPSPYAEYLGYFQQELLFLQQGLRQYDIEQTFTVYFAAPDFGKQHIALDDGEGVWEESFSFVYDKEFRWLTFSELYEPVLTQNTAYRADRDDWAEFLNTAIYKTELSADTELAVPIRFDIPNGPTEEENWLSTDSSLYAIVQYQYHSPRNRTTVTVEYPQFTTRWETPDWDTINHKLKQRVLCGTDPNEVWRPESLFQTTFRSYEVTQDGGERLSGISWTHYADHAMASGMTMDLETKQFLTLQDIIGDQSLDQLLDSGAFSCPYADAEERPHILEALKTLDPAATDNFYLTEDSLGLIESSSPHNIAEAPLSELGLSQWVQTGS